MRQSPLMQLGFKLMAQPSSWQVKLRAIRARLRELRARDGGEQNQRDIAAAEHAAERIEDQRRTVLMTAALLAREPLEDQPHVN